MQTLQVDEMKKLTYKYPSYATTLSLRFDFSYPLGFPKVPVVHPIETPQIDEIKKAYL